MSYYGAYGATAGLTVVGLCTLMLLSSNCQY